MCIAITSTADRRLNATSLAAVIGILLACWLLAGCQPRQTGVDGDLQAFLDGSGSDEQKNLLEQATIAKDTGDYDVALGLFRDVLEENPTIVPAYLGIGDIYLDLDDAGKAEPVFARAVKLSPRSFDAQFGHGRALQMLGQLLRAVQAYHRALTIVPDHPEANLNIATTYMRMDEMNSALVFAEKAVELAPESGGARVNLGAIYEDLGRNDAAIEQYLTALELLDEQATAPVMLNLINVLARENRYQEAANTAENLTRIDPTPNAYERLGWALFKLREYDASIEAYRGAIELDPNHWPSLNGVGVNALNTWLRSGRTDNDARREARDSFRRSLRINRDQRKLITLMSNYALD